MAKYPTWEEKHESRVTGDAYQEAFDRAREQGISHAEAARLANKALSDARKAYYSGRK